MLMAKVKTIIVTEEEREQFNEYMRIINYSYSDMFIEAAEPHFIVIDMDYKRLRVISDPRGHWFFVNKAPYMPVRELISKGLPIKESTLKKGDTCYVRNSIADFYKETKYKGLFPFFAVSYSTELGKFRECVPIAPPHLIKESKDE